jgi:uncharacterized membrane protein YcaP (DUF421 family)
MSFDAQRFAFGETPAAFLIEVIVRIVFLYLVLLVALRTMGRRMSSQLNRNELLALVSLAAAIGPALQDPERGLLPPVIVAIWVVSLQRLLARWSFRSRRFDDMANSFTQVLMLDGRLQLRTLRDNAISRERLFAELRSSGVLQLGAVDSVYIEPSGSFSVFRAARDKPGLSIVPRWDPELADSQVRDKTQIACDRCGALRPSEQAEQRCPVCRSAHWQHAVRP